MAETNGFVPRPCADRVDDLTSFAETGEATEDFIGHAARCPGCRDAVTAAYKQKQADIAQTETDITKAEEGVTEAEERLDQLQDKLSTLEDNLCDMESVTSDIENWEPDEAPPEKRDNVFFRPDEPDQPSANVGGRVLKGILICLAILAAAFYFLLSASKDAQTRDWRRSRQVTDAVKTVLPDPINRCYVSHRMLCDMIGDKDSCAATQWYDWIPWPAPTKVVCPVDAWFGYKHPDRPNFYVIEGNTAVAYRICGDLPADCPQPATEIGRISLPPVAEK